MRNMITDKELSTLTESRSELKRKINEMNNEFIRLDEHLLKKISRSHNFTHLLKVDWIAVRKHISLYNRQVANVSGNKYKYDVKEVNGEIIETYKEVK